MSTNIYVILKFFPIILILECISRTIDCISHLNNHIKNKNQITKTDNPTLFKNLLNFRVVRSAGLEPARLATHAPQTCLSAYSSMTAPTRHLNVTIYQYYCQ